MYRLYVTYSIPTPVNKDLSNWMFKFAEINDRIELAVGKLPDGAGTALRGMSRDMDWGFADRSKADIALQRVLALNIPTLKGSVEEDK